MNLQISFIKRLLPALRTSVQLQHRFFRYSRTRYQQDTNTNKTSSGELKSKPYLPPEYSCNQVWDSRLQTPILKKVELEEFFYEVDKKYQSEKVISPIDVDLFANKVSDEDNLEELEELIYRLRSSPSAADTLQSTGHAVIRTLAALGKTEMLLRILNDRMNYGIFLDFYTANLLMDKFITSGNYRDAAKISSLLMLEEDFGPPTTKFFSLLSCLKYLETPDSQPWDDNETVEEESKDEVKVRVKYLRNPFFDDHFELTNPQHIFGKTLAYLSLHLNEDKVLQNSIQVYGWALYDKWGKVENILKTITQDKSQLSSEAVSKVKVLAEARIAQIESSSDKSLPKPKLKQAIGMNLDPSEVAAVFARLNWDSETVTPLPSVHRLITSTLNTVELPLTSSTQSHLTRVISERSNIEIEEMTKMYAKWDEIRLDELNKQVIRYKEIQMLLEHQEKKKELKDREDTIFFFDHEEEWMMKVEEKEEAKNAEKEKEQIKATSTTTTTTTTTVGKKGKQDKDDDYVSPII